MAAAVDPAWEREPLIVAAMDESVVLPARWANGPLSARRGEGVRARVRSARPSEEPDIDEGGVDTEQWCSEWVRGRVVS
jgi:hypothetical protein